ncbi:hypothetical protein [Nocardioides sp.]|uniref:hypothetical protein n=1 Tax=Nocardioides sp. TaxID=35761 RepID=UPI002B267D22|nr:hypothetical protein [Nocardioides sp.]
MSTSHTLFSSPSRSTLASARRALVGTAAVSLLATSMAVTSAPASAAAAEGSSTTSARDGSFSSVKARRSEQVVDTFGIGIHTAYWDTPYGDTARVASTLKDLGVEHVRDDLWNNLPRSYDDMNYIADAAGVKYTLILGNPSRGQAPKQYVDTVANHLLGSVEMIEGANEWDNFGPDNWVPQLRDYQAELHAAAKANSATKNLPLLAPALAFRENYSKLGTQTGVADLANSHLYPGGRNPSVDIADATQMGEARTGTTETIVTEAGYHNATNTTSGHNPVNENVSATYLPRMLAEHALAGTKRLYTYELLDGGTDTSRRDIEAHFGLLRTDFSPKPAYTAMKNMLAVLDDTEERFTPGSLSYNVSGGGSELRQLLTQRSDGTYVLLLWRDVSVWSNGSRSEIDVATTPVQVSVPQESRIAIHEPNKSPKPTTDGVGTAVEVPLGGQLVAVTISESDSGTPSLPPVEELPAQPAGPAAAVVDKVKANPIRRGAKVRWKLDNRGSTSARAAAGKSTIKVFRGKRIVRTYHKAGKVRSLRVKNLSPKHRYRFAVVVTSKSGAKSKPTVSKPVKPRSNRNKKRSHR